MKEKEREEEKKWNVEGINYKVLFKIILFYVLALNTQSGYTSSLENDPLSIE